jgi:hypothetical protein
MHPPLKADPRQPIVDRMVGLPFVALQESPLCRMQVAGQYPDGSKFRIGAVEDIWNAALCVDAMDQPGGFRRIAPPADLVVLAEAERRYGCTLEKALPIWLNMPKTEYDRWDDRPRVAWHGKVLA